MTPEAVAALADLPDTEFRHSLMELVNTLRAKQGHRPRAKAAPRQNGPGAEPCHAEALTAGGS